MQVYIVFYLKNRFIELTKPLFWVFRFGKNGARRAGFGGFQQRHARLG
jgi:hypothetical protein